MENKKEICELCGKKSVNYDLGFCRRKWPICQKCIEDEIESAEQNLVNFVQDFSDAQDKLFEVDEDDYLEAGFPMNSFCLVELLDRMSQSQIIEANEWFLKWEYERLYGEKSNA